MKMRRTHPNLYLAVMLFGIWGVLQGLSILMTKPLIVYGDVRILVGSLYVVFGTMKLVGGNINHVNIARSGMIGCMVLSTVFAGIAAFKFFAGDLRGPYIALDTFLLGIVQLAAISEPKVNPLTMKREEHGK